MGVPSGFKNEPANGHQSKEPSTADPTLAPKSSNPPAGKGPTNAPGQTRYPVEGKTYGEYGADEPGNDGDY